MKKRMVLTLSVIGLLAFIATIGSIAYYQATITSEGNTITTADFAVSSDGTLDAEQDFALGKFAPGESGLYNFTINNAGTEVPVKYNITITPSGDLFSEGSPVNVGLARSQNGAMGHQNQRNLVIVRPLQSGVIEYEVSPAEFEREAFQAFWKWESSDNDTNYAGKTGNISINVVAEQIPENAINANVYYRDKGTNPVSKGSEINKVIMGMENNQKILLIKDNSYFGNVKLTVTSENGDSLDATMTSSLRPEFNEVTFKINKLNDGFVQIIKWGPEATLELTIPTGEMNSFFEQLQ